MHPAGYLVYADSTQPTRGRLDSLDFAEMASLRRKIYLIACGDLKDCGPLPPPHRSSQRHFAITAAWARLTLLDMISSS